MHYYTYSLSYLYAPAILILLITLVVTKYSFGKYLYCNIDNSIGVLALKVARKCNFSVGLVTKHGVVKHAQIAIFSFENYMLGVFFCIVFFVNFAKNSRKVLQNPRQLLKKKIIFIAKHLSLQTPLSFFCVGVLSNNIYRLSNLQRISPKQTEDIPT